MAIVSRFSVEKAASVKMVAKRSLTQRLRERVGMGDSSESSDEDANPKENADEQEKPSPSQTISSLDGPVTDKEGGDDTERKSKRLPSSSRGRGSTSRRDRHDIEMGEIEEKEKERQKIRLPRSSLALEQTMPADALLTRKDANEFLQIIDPAINPLGIITLEDVLEGTCLTINVFCGTHHRTDPQSSSAKKSMTNLILKARMVQFLPMSLQNRSSRQPLFIPNRLLISP